MFDNQGGLTAGLFRPTTTPQCVLIFYHGGGANMVGYGGLAHTLHQNSPGCRADAGYLRPRPILRPSWLCTYAGPRLERYRRRHRLGRRDLPQDACFLSADTPPGADW